jgi:MFS family permease
VALNALAVSFWTLLYPRGLLAIFSAGLDPASMKVISLHFIPEERGVAYGIYLSTVYIGSALASLTLLLAEGVDWRFTFLICGMVGILACLVALVTMSNKKNPTTGSKLINAVKSTPDSRLTQELSVAQNSSDWKLLIKNRTLIFTLAGTFFRYAAGFSRGYYEALYFTDQFPDDKTLYSVINAIALMLTPISLGLAGWFSDKKESSGHPKWRPLLCAITNLLSVPLLIVMYVSDSFKLCMACTILVYIVGETYISISVTMMINVTEQRLRGLRKVYIETALLFCISFLGGTISTLCLGALNTSDSNLRIGLLCFVVTGYLAAGLLFTGTVFCYPADLRRYEKESIVTNKY